MTRLGMRRPAVADDRGSTLVELMVGMLIMVIFLGMFTGAIVLLYQSSNRADALTTSASQTDAAFSHLDRTVPYAAAISAPGTTPSGWYVEFLSTSTGTATCTQLRVEVTTRQLQARTWATGTDRPTPTAWTAWASGITNGSAARGSHAVPFTLVTNGTAVAYQQLRVYLAATSGSPAVPAQADATFTALDSAVSSVSTGSAGSGGSGPTGVCAEVPRP